jgi:hypothetical protein
MARWKRKEIEKAFNNYQAAALKGARSKDWTDWANCFTEDASYFEHHYGRFWGREDLGDGKIHEEPNITILHYAGEGLFKYEEDAYNPHNMGVMISAWNEARKALQAEQSTTTEA